MNIPLSENYRKQSKSEVLDRETLVLALGQGRRDFSNCCLDNQDLSCLDLSGCDFSNSSFSGANMSNVVLADATCAKADFSGAILSRANLSGCDLGQAKLIASDMVGCDLRRASARAANLNNALLIRAKLNDADFLGACFSGVNATAAQMESVNLECTDFSSAALMNATLCGSTCSWANFTNARMNWATLSWCLLEAADFENANLTGANLQGANLSFANLRDVIITGADLYFATLCGTCMPVCPLASIRVSHASLTSQTYERSGWSRELLREYQRKGAVILDFESLGRDVQAYIREGDCNLRIYFSKTVEKNDRIALEVLIWHLTHEANTLRILSVANNNSKGQVAFYSTKDADIELFISALREKTWQSDCESVEQDFRAYQNSSHVDSIDIIGTLNALSNAIYHIQAIVPAIEEDKASKFHAKLEPGESYDNKTRISWSNVSLPKISR